MKPVPSKLFLWQKLVAIDVQIWLKTKSIGLVPCLLHVIWYDIDLPPRSAEIKGPETIACSDCWKISSQNTLCFCKPLVINAIWKSCVPSLQNKSAVRAHSMIIGTGSRHVLLPSVWLQIALDGLSSHIFGLGSTENPDCSGKPLVSRLKFSILPPSPEKWRISRLKRAVWLTYPGKQAYFRIIMENQIGCAGHRSRQIRQPAAQSKLRELRQRAPSSCFVPATQSCCCFWTISAQAVSKICSLMRKII